MIERALGERFTAGDGIPWTLTLRPAASPQAIEAFADRLPGPLPGEIRELLSIASGCDFVPGPAKRTGSWKVPDIVEQGVPVRFLAEEFFHLDEFPFGHGIAGDTFGNHWIVDIRTDTGAWGPVFFACHDPQFVAIQAPNLAGFLDQVFDLGRAGRTSALQLMKDARVGWLHLQGPHRMAARQARGSAEQVVAAFAIQLPDTFDLVDLRDAATGTGFEWADEEVRRFGAELLFGVAPAPERKGFLGRLFGRG
ncbi:MAG TPA: SMI1/KNR4 family protein [Gemmatimonadales bacterium]|nr:SMI1/KNR4 family protein [Gemmatimonadales bacterium]